MKAGTLYIVATPIGNLEDITFRAVRILKEVTVIFCEDTRTTRTLLARYNIDTKTESYNAHASELKHHRIINLLIEGNDVALVSDAGTPGISDPGSLLVAKVREAGIETISPIPGATAITALLSVSGVFGNEFTFLGFAPHKKGRKTFFESLIQYPHPVIFYESNHRILKALESLTEVGATKVLIGRELTKLHEETLVGTPHEVSELIRNKEHRDKGEFVVLVENKAKNKGKTE